MRVNQKLYTDLKAERDRLARLLDATKLRESMLDAQCARLWDLVQKNIHLSDQLTKGIVMLIPKSPAPTPSYKDVLRGQEEAGQSFFDLAKEFTTIPAGHIVKVKEREVNYKCPSCKEILTGGYCTNLECEEAKVAGEPIHISCSVCGFVSGVCACPGGLL